MMRHVSGYAVRLVAALMTSLAAGAVAADALTRSPAQQAANTATSGAFGLVDNTVVALSPWAFVPYEFSEASLFQTTVSLIHCTATCTMTANLDLPSGARITAIELIALDSNAAGRVGSSLQVCANTGGTCTNLGIAQTDQVGAPGHIVVTDQVDHTVVNGQNYYVVQMTISGGNANTGLKGYRVYYKRQISPAPDVATFSDVPKGHQFFAGVEALAASGITAGCGGGKFCPEDPVTRGQMATFLSRALGLHWEGD